MAFYEDEIKKELHVGEVYTEKEISSIVYFSSHVILCKDKRQFRVEGSGQFKVVDEMDTYIHVNDMNGRGAYKIPSSIQKVYVVEQEA
jgi:hypothetical protein